MHFATLFDMNDAIFSEMINRLLGDAPAISWHEEVRRDLGIPDECAGEAMLTLVLHRIGRSTAARPIAFVIDPDHAHNTVMALTEFLRESFHPVTGRYDVMAVLDFLPPLDTLGVSCGISRRWVIDKTNYTMLLGDISSYVSVVARGL